MEIKKEFGDFQTPSVLADLIVQLLKNKKISPEVIIEPTCGLGSILLKAHSKLKPKKTLGIEIQKKYTETLSAKVSESVTIKNYDFFYSIPLIKEFISDKENLLFIGNPPWVTNSELSSHFSTNLPKKTNFDNVKGIDAITGKSNFDISEYIIQVLIDYFHYKKAVYAILCKTSVAKKIMNRLWKKQLKYKSAEIYPIDSKKYFNAAVDACLFLLDFSDKLINFEMNIFTSIEDPKKKNTSGFYNNVYLEDISKKHVLDVYGKSIFIWRNGVKHDCSKVLELRYDEKILKNGFDEILNIESDLLFPYLKSSDLTKDNLKISKKVLITQRNINESTEYIKDIYPKTWEYLCKHSLDFEKRKSIIYKNKYRYSIFSIGDYTFKPYKIAISGLYKFLNFKFIEPFQNKPVLLDDTCNFISFDDRQEALFIYQLLNTDIVKEYLNSRISWEAKRPIKTEILNSIDFEKIAEKLNLIDKYYYLFRRSAQQQFLFA